MIIQELIIQKLKICFHHLQNLVGNQFIEKKNIVALKNGQKNITLEPGNQIELSGEKFNNIHEACRVSRLFI